jgi:AcrR family transcriptional regulator/DNA-binding MarR family transcriptional regulator
LRAEPALRRRGSREGGHVAAIQRRRLLRAFADVVAQNGLESASVGRVCACAGVSRRTFYDLFADRESCFLAALELVIEGLAQNVVPAYRGDGSWRERLRRALTLALEDFDRSPGLARLCVVETLKGDDRVLDRRREILNVLARAVDGGRAQAKAATVPSPITAESVVGGALAVIHARLLDPDRPALLPLVGPLMSMIVQPYLGSAAAGRELQRTAEPAIGADDGDPGVADPFNDLPIRFTYRTVRVIGVIATNPGASNREVGEAAGASDQSQISKLLRRLEQHDLISNEGNRQPCGERNAWKLTPLGRAIHRAMEPLSTRQ